MENKGFIHPTALVGANVSIGKNVYIGAYSVIEDNVVIEDDVYIGVHCVLGSAPEWKGKENLNNKGLLIKKGSRLTALVSADAGAERQTVIGENCYLMKYSHIGHDSILESNVTISCGVKIGGHVYIHRFTNIGLNAIVHQRITIPEGCMIGAGAFVGKTSVLRPLYKYAGVPVRELGPNIKR